jgi:hypothetical protein
MIEEIKNRLPSPMKNYSEIASKVSVLRGKDIASSTVMHYLNGKDVSISAGTGALIEEVALSLIEGIALDNLNFVGERKAAKVAA